MDSLWHFLEGGSPRSTMFTSDAVLLSLLVAFALGQVLAWVYQATHTSLSYSSSFVQSLILIAVVVSLVGAIINTSIITAFGLMGALALVRFRNVIKDTRDVVFVFASLVIGLGAGSQHYAVAITGTATLCLIAVYLRLSSFGTHRPHNGFLRFSLANGHGAANPVPTILKQFCEGFALVSAQDGGFTESIEYSYQLTIRDMAHNDALLSELANVAGMSSVSLTMQEEMLEV
jgi:hypothetical protein